MDRKGSSMIEGALKGVLHYDASPSVMKIVEDADRSVISISRIGEVETGESRRALADADVLLHVLEPVTSDVMRRAGRLRLVHKIGVGLDAIDLNHARRHGIAVCNLPGTNAPAVAELALALMLTCLRRIVPIASQVAHGGGWPARTALLDGLGEMEGRVVGLVGYGAVARRLAKALAAMGAKVVAHDPLVASADIPLLELDALVAQSDIVSLHIPLTGETTSLFDARRLDRMKRGSILINTARGPLVDERALERKLRAGDILAAGLDVTVDEPPAADHPLRKLENVVMMPHIAWLTDETWRRSMSVIVENCRRLSSGDPLLHRVV